MEMLHLLSKLTNSTSISVRFRRYLYLTRVVSESGELIPPKVSEYRKGIDAYVLNEAWMNM